MHQEVTAEYVRRLLKGELKLKDKALQLKACEVVTEDAEALHELFVTMVRHQTTVFLKSLSILTNQDGKMNELFVWVGFKGGLVKGNPDQDCRSAKTPGCPSHSDASGLAGNSVS